MLYIILFICGTFAWFFSTVVAGGAATMLIPVVSFLLGAQLVAPVVSLAALIANPSRMFIFRGDIDWRVLSFMLPGTILGAILGAWSLTSINTEIIQVLLGLFLISFVIQERFSKTSLSLTVRLPAFLPIGFSVAYLSGLIGATGPLHNPFLLRYGLLKEKLVATKSVNSLVLQLTKLGCYGGLGLLTPEIGLYGLILGAGATLGVYLARNQLRQLHPAQFRQYVLAFMFISGIALLIKALS